MLRSVNDVLRFTKVKHHTSLTECNILGKYYEIKFNENSSTSKHFGEKQYETLTIMLNLLHNSLLKTINVQLNSNEMRPR